MNITCKNLLGALLTEVCVCVVYTYTRSFSITTTQYQRQTHEGWRMKEDAWRNDRKTSLEKYSPLSLFVRFAFERMLETEHKLHILTPLLWPSRCVFLVLFDAQPEVLGSTPSGLFRVPPRSGVAFPTTSGLYCLEFDWQLLWDPNSTELNNISTPTRSPTGSLKSNV